MNWGRDFMEAGRREDTRRAALDEGDRHRTGTGPGPAFIDVGWGSIVLGLLGIPIGISIARAVGVSPNLTGLGGFVGYCGLAIGLSGGHVAAL